MDDNAPEDRRQPGPFAHLARSRPRTDEEERETTTREYNRRRGRGRKNWHLKYIDENGRLKD